MDKQKVKESLSSILYAEHMGDVQRELSRLADLLDLPRPVYNESDDYSDHPYIWPWDKELFEDER